MIFSQPAVAQYLNDNFECAWQSVREVPRVHVDFGGGTTLERTLLGNIATWFCFADGVAFDVLPGLVDGDEFLRRAKEAAQIHPRLRASADRHAGVVNYLRAREAASGPGGLAASYSVDLAKRVVEAPIKEGIPHEPTDGREDRGVAPVRQPTPPATIPQYATAAPPAPGMRPTVDPQPARNTGPSAKTPQVPQHATVTPPAPGMRPTVDPQPARDTGPSIKVPPTNGPDGGAQRREGVGPAVSAPAASEYALGNSKSVVERPIRSQLGGLPVRSLGLTPLQQDTQTNRAIRYPHARRLLAEQPGPTTPADLYVRLFDEVLHVPLDDPFLGLAPDVLGGEPGRTLGPGVGAPK